MPCTANVNMLEKVAGSIEASKGVFVIDYLGLSVKETVASGEKGASAGALAPS